MKQILLTCAFAATTMAAAAQTTDVSPVLGRYAGDLYIALGEEVYDDEAKMDANVYLNASETNGCVNFSLPNFAFSGMALGNIDLPNISLTQGDGSYAFGENPTVHFSFLGGDIEADATLNPATSYVKGDSLVAYVPVIWTNGGNTPIYVLFKGKLANTFQPVNSTMNASTWTQSKPWDSTHGYFDWSALENNEAYWENAKWQLDEYITPSPWCTSHVIGINGIGATCVASPYPVNDDEENPDYAIKLVNTPNPYMPTQVVPGYMTLGTSWATANAMKLDATADGGTFGGVAFTGKPDAIKFSYIHRFGSTDEGYAASAVNDKEPATVVAYLWKGQYKQEEVPGNTAYGKTTAVTMYGRDRNILGLSTTTGGATTKSDDAVCIAQVTRSITETNDEMTEMVVPLDYGQFAGTDVTPDSLNVIFSASDYFGSRSKVGAGNSLVVDNVEFVYYHSIANVKQGDVAITSFDENNVANCLDLKYDPETFSFTKVGEGATVTQQFDNETNTLTIHVESQQIKYVPTSFSDFTIHFGGRATAINEATANEATAAKSIYTLDGRRANSATRGAVIVNGKKILK